MSNQRDDTVSHSNSSLHCPTATRLPQPPARLADTYVYRTTAPDLPQFPGLVYPFPGTSPSLALINTFVSTSPHRPPPLTDKCGSAADWLVPPSWTLCPSHTCDWLACRRFRHRYHFSLLDTPQTFIEHIVRCISDKPGPATERSTSNTHPPPLPFPTSTTCTPPSMSSPPAPIYTLHLPIIS